MTTTKWVTKICMLSMMAIMFTLTTGCGSSGSDDDNNDQNVNESENVNVDDNNTDNTNDNDNDAGDDVAVNNFTGTWLITKEDTVSYWIFNENGTFIKKRAGEPLNGVTHFTGTYSVTDEFLTGDFTNPGVGEGEIQGIINGEGVFLMDFIEYWHSPRKVVPCTGVRP